MKKILKKQYLLIIFIFISILSTILIKPLGDLDEIWNYNVANNIAKGLIPYKDISTITTPLLPLLNGLFLKLIVNELFIMRILAAILGTAIIYMIFKILKQLTKETNISIIVTLLIGILFKEIYCIDYNYMLLFLSLLILYIELKAVKQEEKQNLKKHFIVGFIAGLAMCTKQSIGFLIAIAVVTYPLLKIKAKQDIILSIKQIGMRILGIAIPGILFIIYLLMTNSLMQFIDYGVQGISTFDNKIPYEKLLQSEEKTIATIAKIMPIAISIMVLISIIIQIIKIKRDKKQKSENLKNDFFHNIQKENNIKLINIQILTLYSLPMLIMIYPIADKIHFLIGTTIGIIGTIYIILILGVYGIQKIELIINKKFYASNYDKNNIQEFIKKILRKKKFIYKTITLLIALVIIGMTAKQVSANSIEYVKLYTNNTINKTIAHYKYIEVPEYLEQRIQEIGEYIKEKEEQNKKVYILDAEAAVYMIPLDKYNKNYDMFLKGNIGKDGEQGQIENIKQQESENKIYLIKKPEYMLNWQTPIEVINYIRNNMENIGGISIYDAYTIK